MSPPIGSLVVCSSATFRERAGLPATVGLLTVDRRRDGLVIFPGPDGRPGGRSAWIPIAALAVVEPADPRRGSCPEWLPLVSDIVRLVAGIDIELETDDEGDGVEARIGSPGLDPQQIREIERRLAPAAYRIVPGSMSRVRVAFALTGPPAPRGPGSVDSTRRTS